jgi:hypothetical protein
MKSIPGINSNNITYPFLGCGLAIPLYTGFLLLLVLALFAVALGLFIGIRWLTWKKIIE